MATQKIVHPLAGKIFVIPDASKTEAVSDGGIIMPGLTEMYGPGTVLAAGPGMSLPDGTREEVEVKAGDRIIYPLMNCIEFKHEGIVYNLIAGRDIIGIEETVELEDENTEEPTGKDTV